MRVLVAGASGVLGQPTVRELLTAGHAVVGLARDDRAEAIIRDLGAEAARGDVLNQSDVTRAAEGAEAIVNLTGALPTGTDGKSARANWEQLGKVWRQGTEHLITVAKAAEVQVLVHASLALLYGDRGDAWVTEETELAPEPLVEAALDADRAVTSAAEEGLSAVVLRLGVVYGRDAWHTQILAKQARQRALAIVGDGKSYWSLLHADDAGRAIARAVDDAEAGSVYNVADDRPAQMADLLGLIARLTGAPQPSRVPALLARALVGGDVVSLLTTSVRLSNRAIKQDLELTFQYPTAEEGLKAVLSEPLPDPA
jgi:nucleoside-diphosphate-sugar epimerase